MALDATSGVGLADSTDLSDFSDLPDLETGITLPDDNTLGTLSFDDVELPAFESSGVDMPDFELGAGVVDISFDTMETPTVDVFGESTPEGIEGSAFADVSDDVGVWSSGESVAGFGDWLGNPKESYDQWQEKRNTFKLQGESFTFEPISGGETLEVDNQRFSNIVPSNISNPSFGGVEAVDLPAFGETPTLESTLPEASRQSVQSGVIPAGEQLPTQLGNTTYVPIKTLAIDHHTSADGTAGLGEPTKGKFVTNGGFFGADNVGNSVSSGVFVEKGKVVHDGWGKTEQRGIVGVREDGSVFVDRLDYPDAGINRPTIDTINAQFETSEANPYADNPFFLPNSTVADIPATIDSGVVNAQGGGALLIENGDLVSQNDFATVQQFDQNGNPAYDNHLFDENGVYTDVGWGAAQNRQTDRTFIGTRNGEEYHVVMEDVTALEGARELRKQGFDTVVGLDAGSTFFADQNGVIDENGDGVVDPSIPDPWKEGDTDGRIEAAPFSVTTTPEN